MSPLEALRGAAIIPAMIIAIDGPAGAGKSTIARALAAELGVVFLDTGAMYRAVTLAALRAGVDLADEAAVVAVARELALDFDEAGAVWMDGQPAEPEIRSEEVTARVSEVAALPAVRRHLVAEQRRVAELAGSVVAEGRDVTTVVFPEAEHRFFLDASVEERARRRAAELGTPERAPEIREAILLRDQKDSSRADSPLRLGRGVQRVDTDDLDAAAVVRELVGRVGREA